MAFSTGFLRILVSVSGESDNEEEVNLKLTYVLICFGCLEYVGGRVSGRLADHFN